MLVGGSTRTDCPCPRHGPCLGTERRFDIIPETPCLDVTFEGRCENGFSSRLRHIVVLVLKVISTDCKPVRLTSQHRPGVYSCVHQSGVKPPPPPLMIALSPRREKIILFTITRYIMAIIPRCLFIITHP